ncbi:MAG: alpha/beta fold hydrolase [bacterium]
MIALVLASVALVSAVGLLNRRRVTRSIEREYVGRFAVNASGVVAGAEGFTLTGTNGRALLLLHGSGDTPQSLRYVANKLNAAGFDVHAPLLPGHGRTPHAFAAATAAEYHDAARRALAALNATHQWVGVIGLSMGGALAARIAAESPGGVRALILLAPYMIPPRDVRVARNTSRIWSAVTPYLRGRGQESVHDPVARDASRAYGSFSAGALEALSDTAAAGYRALPLLTMPLLVINSEQDNRIPRDLAQEALDAIRAPVEQHWLKGCGHVITVDYCKDDVVELVLAFLARHAG